MILMISRGMVFVLEQPSSSLAYRHPRFQQLLKMTNAPRWNNTMKNGGAHTILCINIYIYVECNAWRNPTFPLLDLRFGGKPSGCVAGVVILLRGRFCGATPVG